MAARPLGEWRGAGSLNVGDDTHEVGWGQETGEGLARSPSSGPPTQRSDIRPAAAGSPHARTEARARGRGRVVPRRPDGWHAGAPGHAGTELAVAGALEVDSDKLRSALRAGRELPPRRTTLPPGGLTQPGPVRGHRRRDRRAARVEARHEPDLRASAISASSNQSASPLMPVRAAAVKVSRYATASRRRSSPYRPW